MKPLVGGMVRPLDLQPLASASLRQGPMCKHPHSIVVLTVPHANTRACKSQSHSCSSKPVTWSTKLVAGRSWLSSKLEPQGHHQIWAGPSLILVCGSSPAPAPAPAPLGMGGGNESPMDTGQEEGPGSSSGTDLPGASSQASTPLLSLQKAGTVFVPSHFSHVQLFATPWTVAHQAPLSMGFSRQESWSGLPCPPPGDLPHPGTEPTSLTSPALASGFFTTSEPALALAHF